MVAVSDARKGSAATFFGCTACTVSHLPRARVAAESWRQHHPESPFVLLLIDGEEWPREREPFEIMLPEELGLPGDELAVQSGDLRRLRDVDRAQGRICSGRCSTGERRQSSSRIRTCASTPRRRVGGSCNRSRTRADSTCRHGQFATTTLLPAQPDRVSAHHQRPLQQRPRGCRFRRAAIFWTGGTGGWRGTRLKESSAGIWTDQIWVDWAPSYFQYAIVRDSSLDVAFWNLDERELHEVEGRPMVDGAPLRHFHFAGFDPQEAERLSTYLGDASALPQNPVVAKLLRQYGELLAESGAEELSGRPYGYDVGAGGRPLDHRRRAIYREAVLAAEARGTDRPPNPFDPSRVDEFERLVDDPTSLRALSPRRDGVSNSCGGLAWRSPP